MNLKLKRLRDNTLLELIVRWMLGIVFIYASWHKIAEPAQFAKIIYGYGLFPAAIINLTAITLPFVELFSGVFLIAGIYPRAAALNISGMLLIFIFAITTNLIRGHNFDCGCFSFSGKGGSTAVGQLLVRDIIYFLMGLHLLFYRKDRRWCFRPKSLSGCHDL